MGTKGRSFEYRQERDADLARSFRRQLAQAEAPFLLTDILTRTVDLPSRRFWVSPERAYCIISRLERGGDLSGMTRNKRRMFMEIYRRLNELRHQPGFRDQRLSHLVNLVIEQQAPCFYMTPGSAAVVLHHIRKSRRPCRRS